MGSGGGAIGAGAGAAAAAGFGAAAGAEAPKKRNFDITSKWCVIDKITCILEVFECSQVRFVLHNDTN